MEPGLRFRTGCYINEKAHLPHHLLVWYDRRFLRSSRVNTSREGFPTELVSEIARSIRKLNNHRSTSI